MSARLLEGRHGERKPIEQERVEAEYDHRAREARRRAEQLEQQLVLHDAIRVVRVFRVFRLLGASVAGGRKEADTTGSLNDQPPCDISTVPVLKKTSAAV